MKKWNTKKIAAIFDRQAAEFATYAPKSFFWRYIDKSAFDQYVGHFVREAKVLDVGCGSGRVANYLIERGIRPQNILGIDISTKLVAIAKEKNPQVTFEVDDVADLHTKAKDFDLVIAHMVFELLDNEAFSRALHGLYQRMKTNGMLFYINKHPLVLEKNLGDAKKSFWTTVTPWGLDVPNYHRSVRDYVHLTIQGGFVVDEVVELSIPEEARNDAEYARYKTDTPARLAVQAHKK